MDRLLHGSLDSIIPLTSDFQKEICGCEVGDDLLTSNLAAFAPGRPTLRRHGGERGPRSRRRPPGIPSDQKNGMTLGFRPKPGVCGAEQRLQILCDPAYTTELSLNRL